MPHIPTVAINGRTVRAMRKMQGKSTREIAEPAAIDRSYIARIESGERPNVSPEVLDLIAAALEVEPDAISREPLPRRDAD